MTTQYTPILQLALPVTGELNGTWGDVVNDNITSMVEEAIAGLATISTWTANSHTLTTADGVTDEARCAMLVLQTGAGGTALSGAGQVICPARTKLYVVKNDAAYAVTLKTSGGTGISVSAGDSAFLFCDGTNVVSCVTQITNGHITGNLTVDGNATINGNTTLGNATSDTITATARFASDVNPSADNTYDLGTAGNSWRNLYIDGTGTIATIVGTNLQITNLKANDGTAAGSIANSTGVVTLNSAVLTTADINGGTIDATSIGATTPSTGVFTQVDITAQGDLRLQDASGGQYVAMQAPATVPASYTLTWPDTDGDAGQALVTDGSGVLSWSTAASGDVYGPASATDNAVTRFDGTTGKLIQNSGVIIDDSNNVTGVVNFTNTGSVTLSGGTANGVAYLNGSKVLTTGSALTFDGTTLTNAFQGNAEFALNTVSTPILSLIGGAPSIPLVGYSGVGLRFGSVTGTGAAGFSEQMRLNSTGLGIGTSSPTGKIHAVQSGIGITSIIAECTHPGNNAQFISKTTTRQWNIGGNIADSSSGALEFYDATGGATRMRIDSSGNLGLGVTPSAWTNLKTFQVSNAAYSGDTTYAHVSANAYYNGGWKYISNDAATNYYTGAGSHYWRIAPSGTAGNAITFTQAMTLDSSGRLSVGATSNIGGNTIESVSNVGVYRFTAAASGPFINLGKSRSGTIGTNTIVQDQDNLGTIAFYGANGTGYTEAAYIRSIVNGAPGASNDMPGALLFATTADGAGSATERMRIDSSGNVGIGVSSPVAKLDVIGTAGTTTLLRVELPGTAQINIGNGGASTNYYDANTQIFRNGSGASERMRIDSSGNVGIGTSSPDARLTIRNPSVTGEQTVFDVHGATNTTKLLYASVNQTTDVANFGTGYGAPLAFVTNATERMRIDVSGNLLVGTTTNTNSSKLVVNGTISETVGGTQYLVLSQADIGTAPNEVPVNGMLGKLAFEDVVDTVTNNPYNDTAISDVQPSLLLDFANSKVLDPRVTFTRSTTATYYNGVTTAMAEQNLLTYSQEFDNAIWFSGGGASKTANSTTAPDGTATADLITATATSTANGTFRTYSVAIGSTISVYAKKGSSNYIGVSGGDNNAQSWAYFDLNAGTVGNSNACTASITSVGNGWYRCALGNITVAGSYVIICTVDALGTTLPWGTTATAGNSFYVWGAQLEQRSAVSSYTPTTSAAITNYIPVMQTAAAGVPRFDCNPVTGESLGLLIEEQRTNLLTYSSEFDNASWAKANLTAVANSIVAPDGTLTGDTLVTGTTAGAAYQTNKTVNFSAGAYTLSVYVKYAGVRFVQLAWGSGASNDYVNFDVLNGVLGSSVATASSITPVGNGWYRCVITSSVNTTTSQIYISASSSASSTRVSNYTGDGYSGIYIWGAQLEAGSFATSYIPTTSASVTRNADAASMTGGNFSSWFNQAEGTLYYDFNVAYQPSYTIRLLVIDDGSTNNSIQIQYSSGKAINFAVDVGGSNKVNLSRSDVNNGISHKLSSGYKQFDSVLCVDSTAVSTSNASFGLPSLTALRIGSSTSGTAQPNGTIKKLAYYPKRLSDAELQEMTL